MATGLTLTTTLETMITTPFLVRMGASSQTMVIIGMTALLAGSRMLLLEMIR